MTCSIRSASFALVVASHGGFVACADPCVDDGLAQKAECASASATATVGAEDTSGSGTGDGSQTETDPSAGTGSGGSYECPALDLTLEPHIPTIQIVLDRSGSMRRDFDGVERWLAVRNTLVDPADGAITQLESEVRFGISMYTADMNSCPIIDALPPALDAADEIRMLIDATEPGGSTPTGESLSLAMQTLLNDTFDGEKFLVLATDGEPDTCAVPEPMTPQEIEDARAHSVDAVSTAYQAGIPTYVISVGSEIATDHLQEVANAGVGKQPGEPDAPFYQALDQVSLIAAFDDIVAGVRDCKVELDKPLTDQLAPSCDVAINDAVVPYDDPDGWRLDGETTVELLGTTCVAIQEGTVTISMTCTCEIS